MYDNMKGFQTKLWLWKSQLKNGNLVHFKTCVSVFVQSESQLSINDYSQTAEDLICEFEKRFHDFKNYELKFVMLLELFTFDVEKADELKVELIHIQCNAILRQKFCEVCVPNFYSFLPRDRSPKLLNLIRNMCYVL
jgi:hypothetical protein